ncbi:MAG: hypothetical protein IJO63_04945 [Bacilli bacterium]|nr:hypothetical protein [Bacilli bacterium]
MKVLSSEMTSLLDKLYNLRGEDSVILVSMDKEKQTAVETRDRTSALKAELQSKINDLTSEETVLAEEGEKLKTALAAIKKDEFATVIEHLNIDFDPEAIKSKVDSALPLTIEKVATEKKEAAEELVQVEDEMNAAITKIEELGIRKDEALSNQSRLNRYFELALSSNINITRDEITSLLAKFNFSEEEQREAAKLLMFPEDGLFDYEESFKDRPVSGKSIGEVIQEAREVTPVVDFTALAGTPEPEAEPVIEEAKEPAIKIEPIEITKPIVEVPVVEPSVPTAPVAPVGNSEADKDKLIELLTKLGFDYLDFTSNDFAKLLENYDEELISSNVALIEELKINKDVFNDNIELLYDRELKLKIEKLTSVGKAPQDIYLNPNVLVKYSLNELDSAIKTLHESGLEPKNVPLMAY